MTAEALTKYNEDEPRDDRGRWTDSPEGQIATSSTVLQVQDRVRSLFPGSRVRIDSTIGLRNAKVVGKALVRVGERFPNVVRLVRTVSIGPTRRLTLALVAEDHPRDVVLNKLWSEGHETELAHLVDQIVDNKWGLAKSTEDVLVHELGHVWAADRFTIFDGTRATGYATDQRTSDAVRYVTGERVWDPSAYARRDPSEYLGEAFLAANSGNDKLAATLNDAGILFEKPAQKFDPSEPRDEAGKWTSDGSAEYAAAHPSTKIGAGFETVDHAVAATILRTLGSLQDKFPFVNIDRIDVQKQGTGMFSGRDAWSAVATFLPGPGPMSDWAKEQTRLIAAQAGWPEPDFHEGGTILLNGRFFGPNASLLPEGDGYLAVDGVAGIVTHEFGHAVDTEMNRLSQQGDPAGKAWTDWENQVATIYHGSEPDPSALYHLSDYARIGPFKEAVAELFSVAYTPGADQSKLSEATVANVVAMKAALGDTGSTKIEKAGGSPLTFSTQAIALLRQAAAEAYATGYGDATGDGNWADLEDGLAEDAAAPTVDSWSDGLTGLAALLFGGISAAMLGARIGNYVSGLFGLYNEGFGAAVTENAPDSTVEWVAQGDADTCGPCDERDGEIYPIDGDYPYPGSGRFGSDICRGGPRCRCELVYHLADPVADDGFDPGQTDTVGVTDDGSDVTLAAGVDLATFSVDELRSLRTLLAKYSPDQPRVPAGSSEGGEFTSSDGLTLGDLGGSTGEKFTSPLGSSGREDVTIQRSALKYDESEPRDVVGRWTAGGNSGLTEPITLREARQQAVAKWRAAPVPTAEEAERAARLYATIGARRAESNARGSSDDRARREANLLREFGDGRVAPCVYCGLKMDGVHLTQDRLWPGSAGGRYVAANLIPACRNCNSGRGDKPFGDVITDWNIAALAASSLSGRTQPESRGLEVLGDGTGLGMRRRWISGTLETWTVPGLGYTQTAINGVPVEARTVQALKYSPDQPRDERGRFSYGDHSDDEAIMALGDDPVRWAARDWSGGGFAEHSWTNVREALSRTPHPLTRSSYEHGRILVNAVNAAAPTTYPLYRGMAMGEDDYQKLLAATNKGAVIDLNLSSWTASRAIAGEFAQGAYMTGSGGRDSVVFKLEAGAHAYDATNDIVQGPRFSEHLTAGKFEVVDRVQGGTTIPGGESAGWATVTLRQVGTLNPDQLVGTKVAK